jgi:hypothetical protein
MSLISMTEFDPDEETPTPDELQLREASEPTVGPVESTGVHVETTVTEIGVEIDILKVPTDGAEGEEDTGKDKEKGEEEEEDEQGRIIKSILEGVWELKYSHRALKTIRKLDTAQRGAVLQRLLMLSQGTFRPLIFSYVRLTLPTRP